MSLQTRKVKSKDSTLIAFEKTGAGPALVLIDGAMGYRAHHGGRPLAAEFTVVTYDRRGRGESSDTQPYAVEREIEDIDALIEAVSAPVYLYGFSSGSVLALRAAARLGGKIAKLVVLEPPFGGDDADAKAEHATFTQQLKALISANRRSDAVELFLKDMLPTDILEQMKQTPDWSLMEAIAPTLAYDMEVMGDGAVPVANATTLPTLILTGGESPDFKHEAADTLAKAMPSAQQKILEGEMTQVSLAVLAPVLKGGFLG